MTGSGSQKKIMAIFAKEAGLLGAHCTLVLVSTASLKDVDLCLAFALYEHVS